jgi:rhamnogalacturonan endolyase
LRPAVAAAAALLAAPAAAPAAVGISGDASTVVLTNDLVRLAFDRRGGSLASWQFGGRELLGRGGGYAQVALGGRGGTPRLRWEAWLVRREPDLVELAFTNAVAACPFDLAHHYTLRSGEPGFWNHLAYGHDAARSPGVHELGQFNFCLRVNPGLFTTAAVDDARIVPFPRPEALRGAESVMDATYRLPDGGIYSKYFFSAAMEPSHRVHGALGAGVGVWIAMPSHEHLNGGPEHQELTVHQTDTTPVLLRHAVAGHYGAGAVVSASSNGSWRQVSAPCFVFANAGGDAAALWRDAKARADAEAARWPHAWLGPDFLPGGRGRVAGRLAIDGAPAPAGAWVILATHEEPVSPLDWQRQWRGCRYAARTTDGGRFDLAHVRPGLHDLYAWSPGRFGRFVQRGVAVGPRQTTDVATLDWRSPPVGDVLWQIGTPDRTSAEFGFAEDFRRWGLWDRIAEGTTGGVTFVVGRSRDRDWPFQMAATQAPDFSWRVPEWHIVFTNAHARTGRAVLTLGICGHEGRSRPQLRVALNGAPLGEVDGMPSDGAAHRSGLRGLHHEHSIGFDASRLAVGTNVMAFAMPSPGRRVEKKLGSPAAAVLWDCLRLEAGPAPGQNR